MERMNSECQTTHWEHDSQAGERVWYACTRFMYVWCSHMNMIYVCNDVRTCITHLSSFEVYCFSFCFCLTFCCSFVCCVFMFVTSCCLLVVYLRLFDICFSYVFFVPLFAVCLIFFSLYLLSLLFIMYQLRCWCCSCMFDGDQFCRCSCYLFVLGLVLYWPWSLILLLLALYRLCSFC